MLVAVHVTVAVALHRNPPALAHVTASCITCINTGPCVQIKVACTDSTMQYLDNKNIWFSYIIFHWTINKICIHNYIEHSFQLKLQLAGITVGITKAMQRHFQYVIPLKGFYSLHPHIPSGSGRGGSCISEQLKEKLSDRPFAALIHLITTIQLCIHVFFWYLHLHRCIPWDPLHSRDRVYCSHHCHHHRDWGLWRKSIDVYILYMWV